MRSIFPFLFTLISACNLAFPDLPNDLLDENSLVQFNLPSQLTSNSTEWTYAEPIAFSIDKNRYIDSIIFTPNIRSQSATDYCIAELYNHTEKQGINGSTVYSKINYIMHQVRSGDLSKSIDSEIQFVGIRFKSAKENNYVEIGPGSSIGVYYRE